MLKKLIAILFFLPLLGSTCQFGSAHFESNLKNFSFNPDGTIFAYVENKSDSNGAESRLIHVMMTWISIDPGRDLNDFGETQKNLIIQTFKKHDRLYMTFDNNGTIVSFWIQTEMPGVNVDKLSKVASLQSYHIDDYTVSGKLIFEDSAPLIGGTFTAPILQGKAAEIAKQNWEELTK